MRTSHMKVVVQKQLPLCTPEQHESMAWTAEALDLVDCNLLRVVYNYLNNSSNEILAHLCRAANVLNLAILRLVSSAGKTHILDLLCDTFIQHPRILDEVVLGMVEGDNVKVAHWLAMKNLLPVHVQLYPYNRKLSIWLQ
jgi:hypothetical protein